ncbi:HPr family phosphocarrier protein [Guptibacillus hwajinpoensis]|uniref:HPr family phosphocarrier protein n=1 Tax=Guptibacillus hwajinpoensis TaxID=208199 RepID=UPI001CFEF781|nr:HPr family phosphocarrier protein [Pseudalkalibacillus hwajinpoensis]WLR57970.1 HPr family phosphocarrier protein [Pseudalkalibacillus hwajinpoensis]
MKNVETTTINLTEQLSMNSLMAFVKKAKSFNSHVSLYRNGHSINAKNLTSVITFNLTVKENDSLLLIADGEDATEASMQLEVWLQNEMDSAKDETLSLM